MFNCLKKKQRRDDDSDMAKTRTLKLNVPEHSIDSQDPDKKIEYPDNSIKTTKYTKYTYFPSSFVLQFMNVVNLFYLCNGVMQFFQAISTVNPFLSNIPLAITVVTGMIKEGVIDYSRYKQDQERNKKKCQQFKEQQNEFYEVKWESLKVGQIIRLKDKELVPADIIILATSEEHGQAYCSTATLDGERTLKSKQAMPVLQNKYLNGGYDELLLETPIEIECEDPDKGIQNFDGTLTVDKQEFHISISQLLLRGSIITNTDYIIGIVAYTGKETKIMLNTGQIPFKQSRTDRLVNIVMVIQLVILSALVIWMGCMNYYFTESHLSEEYLFYGITNTRLFAFKTSLSYYLLFNQLIPLALSIITEVLKIFSTLMIEQDVEMYSEEFDLSCKCLNFQLHENLGSVKHVFTDKTGTLTCNKLSFRGCIMGDKKFDNKNEQQLSQLLREFMQDDRFTNADDSSSQYLEIDENFIVKSPNEVANLFFLNICLCNEVVVVNVNNQIEYHGSSTDEVTLLNMMDTINYKMKKRTQSIITLDIADQGLKEFKVLEKFEFTCERKRMSIIVQMPDTDQILLLSKGADQVMLESESPQSYGNRISSIIKQQIHKFSCKGYRILCMGVKQLDIAYYTQWQEKYHSIKNNLYLQKKDRETQLQLLVDEIEKGIFLIGASALEDQLQDEVPQVIDEMRQAGIKVWMLTGDKLETAENIGYSCKLFNNKTNIFRISDPDAQRIGEKFKLIKQFIQKQRPVTKNQWFVQGDAESETRSEMSFNFDQQPDDSLIKEYKAEQVKLQNSIGLILQGHSVVMIQNDDQLKEDFLYIASKCDAIIICRASPSQKASVVQLVKDKLQSPIDCVLAIGDGSNDVAMIHTAHIGIGLYGVEGTEAASSADYALVEFKHIRRLIFFHGMNMAYKMNNYIQLFLFKSSMFSLVPLYFSFFNGYSGQKAWEDMYYSFYAFTATFLGLVTWQIFEQPLPMHAENKTYKSMIPYIYSQQRENDLFSVKKFMMWQTYTYFASAVTFFIPAFGMSHSKNYNGLDIDQFAWLLCSYSLMVTTHNVQTILYTKNFTQLITSFYFTNVIVFCPILMEINNSIPSQFQYKSTWESLAQFSFWTCLVIGVFINCLPLYLFQKTLVLFYPRLADRARKLVRTKGEYEFDYSQLSYSTNQN